MKKIILMFVMLIITSLSVMSIDTWGEYQYDLENTGIYEGSYEGLFNDGVESFTYKFKGFPIQPLFIDINNDSINEYITIDTHDFIIYNVSNQNELQIQFQISTGQSSADYRMSYYDNKIILLSDYLYLNGHAHISVYEWINETLIMTQSNSSADKNIMSGVTCDYINTLQGDYCYYYVHKNSGTGDQSVIRYNMSNNIIDLSTTGDIFASHSFSNRKAPIISDLNNDGIKWVYMSGQWVWNEGRVTRTNTDTLISDSITLPTDTIITGLSVHDVDGGYKELVISYYFTSGNKDAHITIRNYALSEQYHITFSNPDPTTYAYTISNTLYADFVGDSDKEFCTLLHTTGDPNSIGIYCNDVGETPDLKWSMIGTDADEYYFNMYIPIISAKMREDINNKYSIVTGSAIFFIDESKIISYDSQDLYGMNGLNLNYPIITDINNNYLIDICSSGSGETFCAFNSFENKNAFFIGSFGSTTPRKQEQPESNTVIYEDICINSTHTFFTVECTDTESYRCNYLNDLKSDTERLLLTCPDGQIIETAFQDNEINFTCNFSTLGIYKFPVFLQDNYHDSDLTEFKHIKVNVINGTEYIDCNLAVNIYDLLPRNETETIQEDEEGTDEIQTGSTAIGDYCDSDSDCITGKCMAHLCVYRLFGEACLNDEMCLSGKCVNGRCNKPSMSQLANQARKENFGNDDDTNIIIGMLVCIGGMLFIIAMGRNIIACIIGAVWYLATSTAFVMLQWMPSFIFFINLFFGVVAIILYFSFKGE